MATDKGAGPRVFVVKCGAGDWAYQSQPLTAAGADVHLHAIEKQGACPHAHRIVDTREENPRGPS